MRKTVREKPDGSCYRKWRLMSFRHRLSKPNQCVHPYTIHLQNSMVDMIPLTSAPLGDVPDMILLTSAPIGDVPDMILLTSTPPRRRTRHDSPDIISPPRRGIRHDSPDISPSVFRDKEGRRMDPKKVKKLTKEEEEKKREDDLRFAQWDRG